MRGRLPSLVAASVCLEFGAFPQPSGSWGTTSGRWERWTLHGPTPFFMGPRVLLVTSEVLPFDEMVKPKKNIWSVLGQSANKRGACFLKKLRALAIDPEESKLQYYRMRRGSEKAIRHVRLFWVLNPC